MQRDRHPIINIPSFSNAASLASLLSLSEENLFELAENITDFYKPGKVLKKKNGEPRFTHDAKSSLKQVHERIKNRILKKVDYPYYMLGGISDPMNPRSCMAHAAIHSGKKILILEDIANFYPSTSQDIIKNIWKYLFNFSDNISNILTTLTTYNGELPQGWKTSGYLANLALWEYEPELVETLEEKGFFYSRFIDDITVSSKFHIASEDKEFIISSVYGMLFKAGYSPKRTKHEIVSRESPMTVTSLNVNTKIPTIPSKLRNNIRAMVFHLEKKFSTKGNTVPYYKEWISVYGKVNRVKSFHAVEGANLQNRMKVVKPPKILFQKKG